MNEFLFPLYLTSIWRESFFLQKICECVESTLCLIKFQPRCMRASHLYEQSSLRSSKPFSKRII